MTRLWRWWVERCKRRTDPLPLAMTRVLVCAVIVIDLLRGWALGLAPWMWRPYENGGLSTFRSPFAIIDDIDPVNGGPALMWVSIVSLTFSALGVATRPALLVGLLAYSQIGHLYPPGDRGVDRLLRTVMLILLFSGAHKRLSLVRWWRSEPRVTEVPAWPADLIAFILVLVYLSAGFHKVGANPRWIVPSNNPPLFKILTDPLAAWLQPDNWDHVLWLFQMGSWYTILLECSAFLILTRWRPYWAVGGAAMHLGIATFMVLGMFSWGMLSLYPVLFAPWIIAYANRSENRVS